MALPIPPGEWESLMQTIFQNASLDSFEDL